MRLKGECEPDLGTHVVGDCDQQRRAPGIGTALAEPSFEDRQLAQGRRQASADVRGRTRLRALRHLSSPPGTFAPGRVRCGCSPGYGMTSPYLRELYTHPAKASVREFLTAGPTCFAAGKIGLMSYQVLARKWRPRNFESLVGQEHVVKALRHALDEKRLHHAYLFSGTRGVGKTTLARILAKCLNCETGISSRPCGKCSACVEIDSGRFVDLIEVDAATNTKVDEMRQLLENSVYVPTRGRFKVYVIDEVHMLSTSAFNAMLKTLEEPPEHIKFILATTDPQKIPVTVLSRCLQFNLKQMPSPAIAAHLEAILGEEKIPAEAGALRLLAECARGSMRDALSLLDQAIAHAARTVTEQAVRAMLGAIDDSYLYSILESIAKRDARGLLAVVEEMRSRSVAFDNALQELGSLLHRIALAQAAPEAIDAAGNLRDRLLALAKAFDPEDVQLCYQIAIHGRQDLPFAPDDFAGFTMALLRMLAF